MRLSPGSLPATPVCCRCYSPAAGSLFLRPPRLPLPQHPILLSPAEGRKVQRHTPGSRLPLTHLPAAFLSAPGEGDLHFPRAARRSPARPPPQRPRSAQVATAELGWDGDSPNGPAASPCCRARVTTHGGPDKAPGKGSREPPAQPFVWRPRSPPPAALPAAALGTVAAGHRAPPAGSACPAGRSRRPPRSAPAPQVPDVRRRLQPCRARPGEAAVPRPGPHRLGGARWARGRPVRAWPRVVWHRAGTPPWHGWAGTDLKGHLP